MSRTLIKSLLTLKSYFNILHEKDDQKVIYEEVRAGVNFRGANAWVLVFAIFTASLGLNVNSTAVIIGAMLISPLMGPIIGIGFSIGVYDLNLLKLSYRNLAMATLISVFTAMIYFLITPLDEAQSELLARTSPTIYDVLIALFGGAAGVVALFTRGKGGNVIPGVAIATALMPPLCTAGYGLAMGNLSYFFGAFYLFFINTVFICVATFLGVRLMKLEFTQTLEDKKSKQVGRIIVAVVILTMIPACFFTANIVRETYRENKVRKFLNAELSLSGTHIFSSEIHPKEERIDVIAMGREITLKQQKTAEEKLPYYGLENWKLNIIQGSQSDSLLAHHDASNLSRSDAQQRILSEQASKIQHLEEQIAPYAHSRQLSREVATEMSALFPQVSSVAITPAFVARVDTTADDKTHIAIVSLRSKAVLKPAERSNLAQWLKARSKVEKLRLIVVE